MATRAMILKLDNPESDIVHARYQHWDGYPSGLGATLAAHYADEHKIDQLLAQGHDMSALGPTLEETQFYPEPRWHPEPDQLWRFVTPHGGTMLPDHDHSQEYTYVWSKVRRKVNVGGVDYDLEAGWNVHSHYSDSGLLFYPLKRAIDLDAAGEEL